MTACPFCDRIKAGEYETRVNDVVSFTPLSPVTPGHLLVVPATHVADALSDLAVTGTVFAEAARLARGLDTDCNLITSSGAGASQTVFHFHVHLVPRRHGDGILLPWPQNPKCGYCYCPLMEAPECADGCGHRDLQGHITCGLKIPPTPGPLTLRRNSRPPTRGRL